MELILSKWNKTVKLPWKLFTKPKETDPGTGASRFFYLSDRRHNVGSKSPEWQKLEKSVYYRIENASVCMVDEYWLGKWRMSIVNQCAGLQESAAAGSLNNTQKEAVSYVSCPNTFCKNYKYLLGSFTSYLGLVFKMHSSKLSNENNELLYGQNRASLFTCQPVSPTSSPTLSHLKHKTILV